MRKTAQDLAQLLGISVSELRCVAGQPASIRFRYQRRPIGKKIRLLRIPTDVSREILDTIKTAILDPMPLPPTMHGWRKRRSTKSYATLHLRKSVLLNVDIQDFFPSVNGGRVYSFWIGAGFTADAAKMLTALTVCDDQLPQGSPTSQSIGNQVLVRLDRRLNGLAKSTRSSFSMYGDEFTISGRRRVRRLKGLALRILGQEGFHASPSKVKDPSHSDRQEIAGIVVNKKPSLGRDEYKTLRAILFNSVKLGPRSQNRTNHPNFRGHLSGRIAHLNQINPKLAVRLLETFNRIQWDGTSDT